MALEMSCAMVSVAFEALFLWKDLVGQYFAPFPAAG